MRSNQAPVQSNNPIRYDKAMTLTIWEQFHALRNTWGFAWRSRIKWQRPGYQEPFEPKTNLWLDRADATALDARYQKLAAQFNLQAFQIHGARLRYLEALTYLDFLTQLFPNPIPLSPTQPLRWLDVGAKNWAYVDALWAYAQTIHPNPELIGIELDAYRVYADFHSRMDYATAFMTQLNAKPGQIHYIAGDVMDLTPAYEVITCFLPFVLAQPALAWGLPKSAFSPTRFLDQLLHLLAPGGVLLIVNQGQAEADMQAQLLNALTLEQCKNLHITPLGPLPASFLAYRYPRFGWRIQKRDTIQPML